MAGEFAGAPDVEQLWQALLDGRELITHYARADLTSRGVSPDEVDHRDYVASRGALHHPLGFDANFFGYSAREAELMDPQQRRLLETAWHVAEDAGIAPSSMSGKVGVFTATAAPTYITNFPPPPGIDPMEIQLGNDTDFAAARISYKLGLGGPSLAVSTACSSGLTAVHLACQSLLNGDSDIAFALACSIRFPADRGLRRVPGSILSADGRCRAFSAAADGTVEADGSAGVLLRRLDDACADGDHIYAVIAGSAIGNDGSDRAGFTAPGVEGQRKIIEAALGFAEIDPSEVTYVEAHGTATRLGDAVETRALASVYGHADRSSPCRLGSVKSNLGHLNHAAGMAGLIKVALSVHRRRLPPTLHARDGLNPELDLASGRLTIQTDHELWPAEASPRIAGVSSFGMGGSGVHVLVTQAPQIQNSAVSRTDSFEVIPLSAATPAALTASRDDLAQWLARHPEADLADVGHTLRSGRAVLPYRMVVGGRDRAEVIAELTEAAIPQEPALVGGTVLLFPGQGAERPGMAAGLFESDASFRGHLDTCLEALPDAEAAVLRRYLLDPAHGGGGTELAQPALVATEYATAKCWEEHGLRATAMIGHSVGEITAACLAGVLAIEDAMRLVAARGHLVARSGPGAMLAVQLTPDGLRERLRDNGTWDLAAHNASTECVISGDKAALERIADALRADGVGAVLLNVAHAFHSRHLDPLLAKFAALIEQVPLSAPSRPYLSCVTGTWTTSEQATSTEHWVAHLRDTVFFADAMRTSISAGGSVFLQLGPGRSAGAHAREAGARHVVLGHSTAPWRGVAHAWTRGADVSWARSSRGRRIPVPGYPFQRDTYVSGPPATAPSITTADPARLPVGEWLHAETFAPAIRSPLSAEEVAAKLPRRWRVTGSGPVADALVAYGQELGFGVAQAPEPADEELTVLVIESDAGSHRALDIGSQLDALWRIGGALTGDVLVVTATTPSRAAGATRRTVRPSACGAAAAAAAQVLEQENPGLRIRCVDVASGQNPDEIAADIAAATVDGRVGGSVLWDGRHWIRRLEQVHWPGPSMIRPDGNYLILGGAGTIGLALSSWLAGDRGAKVALVGRRPASQLTPDAEETMALLGDRAAYFAADVTDVAALGQAWNAAETALGPVDGVIHAAGESSPSAFTLVSPSQAAHPDPHLRVKGLGVEQLATLVRDRKPSFVLGLSSLSVLLGGLGFARYAAANAYLESFFASMNDRSETTWAALRLDSWTPSRERTGSPFSRATQAIRPEETAALFDHVFGLLRLGTITASVTDLSVRVIERERPEAEGLPVAVSARHPRPLIATPYRAPCDELEEAVLELLEDLLHIDGIGVDDDFFELGGHSLLAMSLATRLSASLGLKLDLRSVFDSPTAARLAAMIEALDEQSEVSQ
jgi:acyl transferase domain-containing protein/NADP-dependent 3-hydroxy acid dehydrogenase YdfG/acyl carrier protein